MSNNMKSIGDLLGDFSQQKKLKKPLLEARVINLWQPLMGDIINRYTEKIFVKNRVLFVKVNQAALKNESQDPSGNPIWILLPLLCSPWAHWGTPGPPCSPGGKGI